MVFDATNMAFPQRNPPAQPIMNPPILSAPVPAPAPATAQSSDTSNRPAKRRRINELQMPTPLTTPSPAPELDLDALDAARRRSSARVMSLWESLAARYARALDEDDEIDILTGKIYRDRGVLRAASERGWKIGSFGGAMEVEPVGGVSEGETETGASEGDDEGEGDGDGDGAGGVEEEEEEDDPFETWSYDWQYRALSPPKPELSPKDAEDLEEFLAAERAIQENAKKKGKSLEPEEDDDIIYLGDSLHDEDGALRDDDTSDDEFASFMVDSSTIRLKDEEEEDDEGEVGPMSSILGSLAIGGSGSKTLDDAPTKDVGDKGRMNIKHPPNTSSGTSTHQPSTSRPSLPQAHASPSTNVSPASETGVEDELIVIDSDSDEELDADLTPRQHPKPISHVTSSTLVTPSSSKPLIRPEKPVMSSPALAQSCAALTLSETSAPTLPHDASASSSKLTKSSKPSFSAMVALLEASATASTPKSEASTSSKPPSKPTSTVPAVSKRMLPKAASRGQGLDPAASKGGQHALSKSADSQPAVKSLKATLVASTPSKTSTASPHKGPGDVPKSTSIVRTKGKEKAAVSSESASSSPSKTGKVPRPLAQRAPKAKTSLAGMTEPSTKGLGLISEAHNATPAQAVASGSSSTLDKAPKPATSVSAPIASSPTVRLESPTKSRKKGLVLEVVLPPLRHNSKNASRAASSIASPTPAEPISATRRASPSKCAPPKAREHTSSPESRPQAEANPSNKSEAEKDVGTRVHPNSRRKRLRESGEGVKAEESLPEPRTQAKSVEQAKERTYPPAHSLPAPLAQNQPPGYYPMPFGYFPYPPPPLPPHGHPHAAAYASWSHQVHHCSTQHQHQHQHLHTHIPYPFPHRPLAPNQLTEASFGFAYGYAAMPQAPGVNGSTGHGVWYPPGAHVPYPIPLVNQTEASLPVSPPKLEQVSSSQEEIPDSQERVPSSQEHEREKEKNETRSGSEKLVRASSLQPRAEPGPEIEPARLIPEPEKVPVPRPSTPINLNSNNVPSAHPVGARSASSAPKIPTPKRESSVIDIDSDSDDELAGYNVGEGSMRWEPPIKDEEDSDDDGSLDLSAEMDGTDDDVLLLGKSFCRDGRQPKRRLGPRKSLGKLNHKSGTSPVKSRTV